VTGREPGGVVTWMGRKPFESGVIREHVATQLLMLDKLLCPSGRALFANRLTRFPLRRGPVRVAMTFGSGVVREPYPIRGVPVSCGNCVRCARS
jgi:hypothetical protein